MFEKFSLRRQALAPNSPPPAPRRGEPDRPKEFKVWKDMPKEAAGPMTNIDGHERLYLPGKAAHSPQLFDFVEQTMKEKLGAETVCRAYEQAGLPNPRGEVTHNILNMRPRFAVLNFLEEQRVTGKPPMAPSPSSPAPAAAVPAPAPAPAKPALPFAYADYRRVGARVFGSLMPRETGNEEQDLDGIWKVAYQSRVTMPGMPDCSGRGWWRLPDEKMNGLARTAAAFQQQAINAEFARLQTAAATAPAPIPAGLKGRERAAAAFNAQFNKKQNLL